MEFKGSQTEKNLLAAFAGESQARNRYTFFASMAKKEGYEQIAAIFQDTADNEHEHAELLAQIESIIGSLNSLKTKLIGHAEEGEVSDENELGEEDLEDGSEESEQV